MWNWKSYSDVREEEICPSRHNEQPDIQLSEEIHVVAANKLHKNKKHKTVLTELSKADSDAAVN